MNKQQKIMSYLSACDDDKTAAEIAAAVGYTPQQIAAHLLSLMESDLVERIDGTPCAYRKHIDMSGYCSGVRGEPMRGNMLKCMRLIVKLDRSVTLGELSEKTGLTKDQTSKAISLLCFAGFVQRDKEMAADDGRVYFYKKTDKQNLESSEPEPIHIKNHTEYLAGGGIVEHMPNGARRYHLNQFRHAAKDLIGNKHVERGTGNGYSYNPPSVSVRGRS